MPELHYSNINLDLKHIDLRLTFQNGKFHLLYSSNKNLLE